MPFKIAVVFCCLLVANICFSQQLTTHNNSLFLNPEVRRGVLNNGFTFFILKHDSPDKKIDLLFTVNAGSFHEEENEREVAHLLEHISLRSTKHFDNGLRLYFTRQGLKGGRELKASTGLQTSYRLAIPTGDSNLLNKALLAVKDWAKGRLYKPDEIEEEKAAVFQEFSIANTPEFFEMKQMQYLMLDKHPLYEVATFGTRTSNLKNISIETMQTFDQRWYRPDLQMVFIVGDFDESDMEKKVRSLFSDLPLAKDRKFVTLSDVYSKYNVPLNGRAKLIIHKSLTSDSGITLTTFQKRKLDRSLSPSARFNQELIDGLYNELFRVRIDNVAKSFPFELESFSHVVQRQAIHPLAGIDALKTTIKFRDVRDTKVAMLTLMTELKRVAVWGFLGDEFTDAKELVKKRILHTSATETSRSITGELINFYNGETIFPGNSTKAKLDFIDQISLSSFNQRIKAWLKQEEDTDYVLLVPHEGDSAFLSLNEIVAWRNQVDRKNVKRYQKRKSTPLLKPILKRQSSVLDSFALPQNGGVVLKLFNGIKVIIKPLPLNENNPESDRIVIKGFNGGCTANNTFSPTIFSMLSELMPYVSIGSLDADELEEWKASKRHEGILSCLPMFDSTGIGIRGSSSLRNYEALLQLVYWYSISSKVDQKAAHASLRSIRMNDLGNSYIDTFRRIFGVELPASRVSRTSKRQLDSIAKIFNRELDNRCEFTFVISGYLNVDQIKSLTVLYLGNLPAKLSKRGSHRNKSTQEEIGKPVSNRYRNIDTTIVGDSTGNVEVKMVFPLYGPFTDFDRLSLEVLAESVNYLLFRRLREREKGVYGVNSGLKPQGSSLLLYVFFQSSLSDVERLVSATKEEINSLSKFGLEDSFFAIALDEVRGRFQAQHGNPDYWTQYLMSLVRTGNILNETPGHVELLNRITLSKIRSVANRFIDTNNLLILKLL